MTIPTPSHAWTTQRAAELLAAARAATGFMPDDEGQALGAVAAAVVRDAAVPSLVLEVGAYCGKSALYLASGVAGAFADANGSGGSGDGSGDGSGSGANRPAPVIFSLDHHHGSEENQAGWEHHDASLVDPRTGRMDTLLRWRAAIDDAGAAQLVVGLVGDSATIASHWASPIGLLFIDGGHGEEPAWADYHGWAPHVSVGGMLAIHDVFPDPADGGRPPYELYCHALESGAFTERADLGCGSLRVLVRSGTTQP